MLNIGVDLDEVLVKFVEPLISWHNRVYGTKLSFSDVHSYGLHEVWGGSVDEAISKVHDFYKTPEFQSLSLVDGALNSVQKLSLKHRLSVVTSRPVILESETVDFLTKHFPNLFSGIYLTNYWTKEVKNNQITKRSVCESLGIDVIIEDHISYARECAVNGTCALLIEKPWNKKEQISTNENILRVSNWEEIITIINQKDK